MRDPVMVQSPPVSSFAEWRDAARLLLANEVAPHAVRWMTPDAPPDLFCQSVPLAAAATQFAEAAGAQSATRTSDEQAEPTQAQIQIQTQTQARLEPVGADSQCASRIDKPLALPRELLDMLQSAACFRAHDRWAFLYQVLWRWRAGEREVMSIADPDGQRLRGMVKSVRREEHDMFAYVRFRERKHGTGAPRFVAWFEPAHDVLPQVARHFAKRMGGASWMIATPAATVLWDGNELRFGAPMTRNGAAIDDAGERLWLTYYASIFNPARLNTTVMHSHVPGRFWKHLPEGKVVPALVSEAANGGRRHGQAEGVSRQEGRAVKVTAEQAAPRRDLGLTSLGQQADLPMPVGERTIERNP